MRRALFSLLLCAAAGAAVADASLGEMPAVDAESPILQRFADGATIPSEAAVRVLFVIEDSALRLGDSAPFADFADHIFAADTADMVKYANWTDYVGLSYYPPYGVVILDGTLADQPLDDPQNEYIKTLTRMFQDDAEVARLVRGGLAGLPVYVLAVDVATLDRATVSECASRLAVATLYTTTIPEDFSFTSCAESMQ